MHQSIKPIVAGVGVAALLALGFNVATEAAGSTSMYSSGGTPCGFAATGSC